MGRKIFKIEMEIEFPGGELYKGIVDIQASESAHPDTLVRKARDEYVPQGLRLVAKEVRCRVLSEREVEELAFKVG